MVIVHGRRNSLIAQGKRNSPTAQGKRCEIIDDCGGSQKKKILVVSRRPTKRILRRNFGHEVQKKYHDPSSSSISRWMRKRATSLRHFAQGGTGPRKKERKQRHWCIKGWLDLTNIEQTSFGVDAYHYRRAFPSFRELLFKMMIPLAYSFAYATILL